MRTLPETQKTVADFVLAPSGAVDVAGMIRADGLGDEARLSIHRNTTLHTLTDSLHAVYPVVHRLVGEEFFAMVARDFIRAQPPATGVLLDFGGALAGFLTDYAPAESLAYLPDVARLEWAWHGAFHAADGVAVSAESLAAVAADDAEALRLFLHPSLRVIRSRFPIHRIWEINQPDCSSVEPVLLDEGAANLMVLRCGLTVNVHTVDAAVLTFVEHLKDGAALGDACAAAVKTEASFEAGPALGGLLTMGAVTGFVTGAGDVKGEKQNVQIEEREK